MPVHRPLLPAAGPHQARPGRRRAGPGPARAGTAAGAAERQRVRQGPVRAGARALARLGRADEAEPLARRAAASLAAVSPIDTGRAYAVLGDLHEQLGERAQAIELYELALETLPVADRYLLEACGRLAELLQQEGRKDEALSVLTRALQLRTAQQQPR